MDGGSEGDRQGGRKEGRKEERKNGIRGWPKEGVWRGRNGIKLSMAVRAAMA